jgi:hypothetical protein
MAWSLGNGTSIGNAYANKYCQFSNDHTKVIANPKVIVMHIDIYITMCMAITKGSYWRYMGRYKSKELKG